jgi:hypothetical protein
MSATNRHSLSAPVIFELDEASGILTGAELICDGADVSFALFGWGRTSTAEWAVSTRGIFLTAQKTVLSVDALADFQNASAASTGRKSQCFSSSSGDENAAPTCAVLSGCPYGPTFCATPIGLRRTRA